MTIKCIPDDQTGEQKEGKFLRMASYGAAMANAYFFDELIKQTNDQFDGSLEEIIAIEEKTVSALKALNIIGFFTIEEWLQTNHQGRILIALLYLKQNPKEITENIKKYLAGCHDSLHVKLQELIAEMSRKLFKQPRNEINTDALKIAIDPEKIIPNNKQGSINDRGIFYRKGTSVATFENAFAYQSAIDKGITDIFDDALQTAINDQRFITNMMAYGGYFSFFPPIDWFRNEKFEGRMMPALLLLQQFPDRMTQELVDRLSFIKNKVSKQTVILINETLDYFNQYKDKVSKTKEYIGHLFESYLKALENKDINTIAELWLDSLQSTLIVPVCNTWIKGFQDILLFSQNNFANIESRHFDIEKMEIDIDLVNGVAHIHAAKIAKFAIKKEGEYQQFPTPNKLTSMVEFKRIDIPSCQPVLKGFHDWKIGCWKISHWVEAIPF